MMSHINSAKYKTVQRYILVRTFVSFECDRKENWCGGGPNVSFENQFDHCRQFPNGVSKAPNNHAPCISISLRFSSQFAVV